MIKPYYETVPVDENSSFHLQHFRCTCFAEDHPWHYHPEIELAWTLRSSGIRFVGDSVEPYAPDDLVLVGPNVPHCWHDLGGATSADTPEVVIVQFRPDCMGTDFLKLSEAAPILALYERSQRGLQVAGPSVQQVTSILRRMLAGKGLSRLTGLLDILQTLAESGHLRPLASPDYRVTTHVSEVNLHRIQLIYSIVKQNLAAEISQVEIAEKVGLTPPAFSRFFKTVTGQTFVSFVNGLRVNEVSRRLIQEKTRITDIAMACGYNSLANFNRQFQALKGMTPKQFRAEHRRLLTHKISPIYSIPSEPDARTSRRPLASTP